MPEVNLDSPPPAPCQIEDIPPEQRATAFGVTFAKFVDDSGSELYVTPFGCRLLDCVWPSQWYVDGRWKEDGERLPRATGNVYRVQVDSTSGRKHDLVIKTSRFAEEVPLHVATSFLDPISDEELASARFNSPFEEVGLVTDLQRGRFGPPDLHVAIKRPLAVFCPSQRYKRWQLGRSRSRFDHDRFKLIADQDTADDDARVDLVFNRDYITLFQWVKGVDAEICFERDLINEAEMLNITRLTQDEMKAKGFRVLDHKPRHVILRPRRDGSLLRRHDGNYAYCLVDFELLQRTTEYTEWLNEQRRLR